MNDPFVRELRDLLKKYNCYISFDCEGDTYGIDSAEVSVRDNNTDKPLVSSNDVCGSPGWSLDSGDLEGLC